MSSSIHKNVLECIGNTPIVRLNKIPIEEGISCEIVAKCEYFNAGGSIKDRIAKRMIEVAEAEGLLVPGSTIIEPTSGNTGIGLALAGAIKGYPVIITMPEKMSNEKVNMLKALGAEVIRTPTEAPSSSPESHISVAHKLNKEIENSIILDQYSNPNNPLAHYEGTAEEIISVCKDHLDMVVIGAGTGGTISGVAKRLKEKYKNIIVIGVDPIGSILSDPADLDSIGKPYQVEGIGYDFVPKVLETSLIDSWITTKDEDSFRTARRLIKSEGLLCGGSSGSITWAALKAIKDYKFENDPSKRVLIILPDSIRNYMTKFLDPNWMFLHKFMKSGGDEFDFYKEKENWKLNWKNVQTFVETDSVEEILNFLKETKAAKDTKFPVLNSSNEIIGNLETLKLFKLILKKGKGSILTGNIKKFMNKENFKTFSVGEDFENVLAALACDASVYLTDSDGKALLSDAGYVQSINIIDVINSLE